VPAEPSSGEAAAAATTPPRKTRLTRRIGKRIRRVLMAVVVAVVPRLYLAYMWLVWRTSRVEDVGCLPSQIRDHYGRGVVALWHDEVFFVAWAFGRWRPHTLASHGDFGELITRMLELCDFVVFRGGSSAGKSRRSPQVVKDMIEHMRSRPGVLYGITVDGSKGPRYVMKRGAVEIAVACEAPMLVEKTWCRRYFRLPTWDRTIVPLPFNHIVHVYAGPYVPLRDARRPEVFERFWKQIEAELERITRHARSLVEGSHDDGSPGANEGAPPLVRPFDPVVVDRPSDPGDAGTSFRR
jgi:hypothetical protein